MICIFVVDQQVPLTNGPCGFVEVIFHQVNRPYHVRWVADLRLVHEEAVVKANWFVRVYKVTVKGSTVLR